MPAGTEISRDQPADQDRQRAMPLKPGDRPVDLLGRHGEPAAVAPRPTPQPLHPDPPADFVPEQGAGQRSDGPGQPYAQQTQLPAGRREARQRHDQFGGNGRKHILGQHQEGDAEIAGLCDE